MEIADRKTIELAAENVLEKDEDFKITRVGGDFGYLMNLTYRSPRYVDGREILDVSTTTVDAHNFLNLRLEEKDGHYYVVNGDATRPASSLKMPVVSAEIGYQMISSVIDEYSPDGVTLNKELNAPYWVWKANQIAKDLSPLIVMTCLTAIAVASVTWILL